MRFEGSKYFHFTGFAELWSGRRHHRVWLYVARPLQIDRIGPRAPNASPHDVAALASNLISEKRFRIRHTPPHRHGSRSKLGSHHDTRAKHSGNTIVVFCIERAGPSRRLRCSTQGYCGGTRTETADVSKDISRHRRHDAPAYRQTL
jgi:hypothetical protein